MAGTNRIWFTANNPPLRAGEAWLKTARAAPAPYLGIWPNNQVGRGRRTRRCFEPNSSRLACGQQPCCNAERRAAVFAAPHRGALQRRAESWHVAQRRGYSKAHQIHASAMAIADRIWFSPQANSKKQGKLGPNGRAPREALYSCMRERGKRAGGPRSPTPFLNQIRAAWRAGQQPGPEARKPAGPRAVL